MFEQCPPGLVLPGWGSASTTASRVTGIGFPGTYRYRYTGVCTVTGIPVYVPLPVYRCIMYISFSEIYRYTGFYAIADLLSELAVQ